MRTFTEDRGMKQIVQEPTRGDYLLDLVLTSMDGAKVKLGHKLADHASLLIKVPDAVEVRELPPRKIWQYSKANWPQMKTAILNESWDFLRQGSIDDMMCQFNALLLRMMDMYVPFSWKTKVKGSLPWMNQICVESINAKHAAEGTPAYVAQASACQTCLRSEYQKN